MTSRQAGPGGSWGSMLRESLARLPPYAGSAIICTPRR
jgi:hypothetical protein